MSRAHAVGRCLPARSAPQSTQAMRRVALAVVTGCVLFVMTLIGAVWLS